MANELATLDRAIGRITKPRAESLIQQLKDAPKVIRHALRELWEGHAEDVYNCRDFEDFIHTKVDPDLDIKNAYKWIRWATVEFDVFGQTDDPNARLIRDIALELARLPSAEREEAYKESFIIVDNPTRDVKHIVNRRLGVTDKYKGNKRIESPANTSLPASPSAKNTDSNTVRTVVDTEPSEPNEPEIDTLPTGNESIARPEIGDSAMYRTQRLCALLYASVKLRDTLIGHNEKTINLTPARSEALAAWKSAVSACEEESEEA